MTRSKKKQFNPFYGLTVVAGAVFTITAIAYSFNLVQVMKAVPGEPLPHARSAFAEKLAERGDMWLMVEVGLLVAVSVSAMGYDRYLMLKNEKRRVEEES